MGFLCYVCGKMDMSDFFCGLQLGFDSAPPLALLKRTVEDRLATDSSVGNGVTFAVRDFEILDLRLNMWVPLDGRQQLYSGCHIAAVRDSVSGSSAGAVDIVHRDGNELGRLTFAMDAQRLFDALDSDHTAVLVLQGMLRVLRHDPNYCIDLFAVLDRRVSGQVTFNDFMASYHEQPQAFWRELQQRLQHGGALPSGGKQRFAPADEGGEHSMSHSSTPRAAVTPPPREAEGPPGPAGAVAMPVVVRPPAAGASQPTPEPEEPPMAPENQERARRVVSALQRRVARKAGSDAASSASPSVSHVGQRLLAAARRMKAKQGSQASVSGSSAPSASTPRPLAADSPAPTSSSSVLRRASPLRPRRGGEAR